MARFRGDKTILEATKQLDAFRKVPEEYTETSLIGGTLSVLSRILILILIYKEVSYYNEANFKFIFKPDVDLDATVKMNVDVTVATPCINLSGVDITDETRQDCFSYGTLKRESTWWELSSNQRGHFSHAHITDFNIATRLPPDGLACSMSGTKPYMAPEVFMCALEEITGYTFPVDWWSLGIVAYEMRLGSRPFMIHSSAPFSEVKNTLHTPVYYPRFWTHEFVDLISKLLNILPGARISSQRELQQTQLLRGMNFNNVLKKKIRPPFKPPENHLNCDPCLELEEMIVETKPLHKKKKRLAKQRSAQRDSDPESNFIKGFIVYNRYKELKRKAMEQKENEWQKELDRAMANSVVNSLIPIKEKNPDNPGCSKDEDSIDFIDRTPSPPSPTA